MNAQWRLFVVALRFVTRQPSPGVALAPDAAVRFVPLAGMAVGLVGAATYWLAAQLWPVSIAVILALLATALCTRRVVAAGTAWYAMFFLFMQYNALMALSSAKAPLPLPEYGTLGVIMTVGRAASSALEVSAMAAGKATRPAGAPRISAGDLGIALTVGLAPAALLGIPGLIGLAAAIALGLGQAGYLGRMAPASQGDFIQQLTESGFYLGALATWKYV